MIYYLDCEFNGFGGELMSLALVREDGEALYLLYERPANMDPWVAANVWPIMRSIPPGYAVHRVDQITGAWAISEFLKRDPRPYIITDWPDDVRYFCAAVIIGPGQMTSIPSLRFEVVRQDAYPTGLKNAVQHNALWDALALRWLLQS